MTNENKEVKNEVVVPEHEIAMVGSLLSMVIADKMGEAGLIDKPNKVAPEDKLAAVEEGVALIKKELEAALRPTPEAQYIRQELEKEFTKNHYKFFGMEAAV